MPGEFDFISWLKGRAAGSPLVRLGIGDDLAALQLPPDDLLLVGADQVLDGVHFDSTVHDPRAIGRKAVNRNLSDCAAMACRPAAAVATLALPRGVGLDYAKQLTLGMADAAGLFGCPIVGGDTGTWAGPLAVSVTILGRSDGVAPLTRTGARPGDGLFVTGPLGGSIAGRHMTFAPRVEWGGYLGLSGVAGRVHAMLDVSDGLSRDVRHLLDGGRLGAIIDAARVPIHDDAVLLGGRPPLDRALHDGEDYELLFAAAPQRQSPEAFHLSVNEATFDFPRVGTVTAEPGVWLRRADGTRSPLDPLSWEHAL